MPPDIYLPPPPRSPHGWFLVTVAWTLAAFGLAFFLWQFCYALFFWKGGS